MSRTLDQWLAWQESLHPRPIELGLERVRGVAARLSLLAPRCRSLTIAGTNGKGSSAVLAAGIYRAAGYRVGLYTSPHLLRYNERIVINGAEAGDADLCRAFEAIDAARGDVSLTYFEFGTLAALWLFREAAVDVQVLEVGLGGRLDAVNLVDADTALITNIGLDHTDWLGTDREAIGREKAGILRKGRPAIYVDPESVASIRQIARELAVPLRVLNEDFFCRAESKAWHWQGSSSALMDLPFPGLSGDAQLRNAAGVLQAVEALQALLPVPESAIRRALPQLKLSGRFERLGQIVVDVAHNVESAQVLVDNLRHCPIEGELHLVLAMLSDKPIEAVATMLASVATHLYVAGLPGPRGLTADAMQVRLHNAGLSVVTFPDVATAITTVKSRMAPNDLLVVTGSFLTVAAALDCVHE